MGCTTDLKGRSSNYKSHHKKKYISCGITEHFLEDGHDFEADFEFLPIVKLLNPPSNIVKQRERLEDFELYWQENLVPYGCSFVTYGHPEGSAAGDIIIITIIWNDVFK